MKSNHQKIADFSEVVREQHNGLRYFIRSLGVNDAWVDDLAQESFLVAYRKWSELDDPANAAPWLRRIARNLVMNEISKTSRRQRLLDKNITTLLLNADPETPSAGSIHDIEITHEALRVCLSALAARSRRIVDAHYFDGHNATEIGEELCMTSGAVRKVLFKTRHLLADCLTRKQLGRAT